ncbi:LCP family protein [Sediminibacillus massiliensis]|uniref:LCP family protein n=1 Tax=Sediminibacillus massiliensis TaxID=1926277 RepID=UPI0009886EEF|nr:LCP family protein [Sediminibacillus massiliensis]
MAKKRVIKRRRRRRLKWKNIIGLFLVLAVFAMLVTGGYIFYQAYTAAKGSYEELDRPGEKSELREEDVKIGEDPVSILLLGIEDYQTGGKNGRADSQVIITLNPDTEKMTMTTIPRDTRVNLVQPEEYAGYHKINATYTYGSITGYGANKLTVETAENLLDVPIDKYIAINFEGFRDIVDALDGVTIDIKEPFWEKNIYDDNNRIYFEEGPAHLDGEEALAFVRMRKRDVNNIYSREERQRQFIKSAIDEAISAGTIFKVDDISKILRKRIDTNLTPGEIYTLQRVYSSMDSSKIETIELEGSNQRVGGSYYFIPTEEGLRTTSQKIRQELDLPSESSN